jgi:hypothetical protein
MWAANTLSMLATITLKLSWPFLSLTMAAPAASLRPSRRFWIGD